MRKHATVQLINLLLRLLTRDLFRVVYQQSRDATLIAFSFKQIEHFCNCHDSSLIALSV